MDVGVAGVVRHGLALDAAPRRRADDLARLRLDIAEADLLVLAVQREVRVLASGLLAERLPGLDRDVPVGFRRQLQDHLAGVDVGLDPRHAAGRAVRADEAVQLAQLLHFRLRVPGDALAAVADLVHQRPQRSEALVHVRIVALDHRDLRRRLARDQVDLAAFPLLHVERLRELGRTVVHQRRQHDFALHSEVTHADLAEFLREALVDVPVAA